MGRIMNDIIFQVFWVSEYDFGVISMIGGQFLTILPIDFYLNDFYLNNSNVLNHE